VTGKSVVLKTRDLEEALDYAENLDAKGFEVVVYKQPDPDGDLYWVWA